MLRPLRSTICLLVASMVAGCAGDGNAAPLVASSSIPNGDAGGVIAGLVVDDAQLPISGAGVRFAEDEAARAITDAAGRFRIAGLAPGPRILHVERDGYHSATTTLDVVADELTSITIILVEIPALVPRVVSYTAEAIIEMAVNAMGVYYYDNTSGTQYRDIFYPLPADAASAVVGLEWTATSPASAKWVMLSLWLSDPQCRGWCKQVAQTVGRSPLVARVDDIPVARDDHWGLSLNPYIAIEPPCMVATVTECTDAPDAVAQVALDQRFQVYTTLFFVEPAPPQYNPFPA